MDKLQRLYEDLQIHQEELEHQNRELRETHQLLEASRNRYADLYDFAPVCYVDFDDKGRIRNINLTGATLLGVERNRLVDTPFVAFVVPNDRQTFLSHILECRKSKGKAVTEVRLAIRNADPIHTQLHTLPFSDPDIDQTLYRTAITDITDRTRAEEKARGEQVFRKAIEESVLAGIVVTDLSGRIVYINPAFSRMVGWSDEELLGVTFPYPFWPPEEVDARTSRLTRFLRQAQEAREIESEAVESRFLRKDGMYLEGLMSVSTLKDSQGNSIGVLAVIHDISKRKQAEEQLRAAMGALKASEEHFRSLVEHLPVGVLIVQNSRVVFRNPETERLFGSLPENPGFRSLIEVHPEDAEKFENVVNTFVSEDTAAQHFDFRFQPAGPAKGKKTLRWVLCHTSPIEHRGGKAVLVHILDVTRAREMEHLLMAREKLASIGQLSAGIAHEIRNPLSGINIYLSTLEQICDQCDQELDAKGRETIRTVVEQMKSASHEIATVIRRVMDFSKVGPSSPEPVDVNHAVEGAERLSLVSLKRGGVTFSKSLDPHLPKAYADSRLIEQVLMNLIDNAVHAMDHREDPRRIEIASSASGERIVVTVSDSGPGVPIHMREKIFDPFFTTRKEGYGIGLSFSHRVITDHGGSLQVGTGKWGGAEFRIELPIAKEDLPR